MATYCKRPLQGMVNPHNPHGAEYYHCQLLVRATLVAHFYYQKEKYGGTFLLSKRKKWWHIYWQEKKKNIGGMILKLTRLFIHARYGPS